MPTKPKKDSNVLIDIIIESLKQNPRIVVPQLGAFIVKGDEQRVIFSALLKQDDGVLRAIVTKSCNNELEAAGKIDRFVFEVRHALYEESRSFPLGELGELRLGANGNIVLSPMLTEGQDLFTNVESAPIEEAIVAESEDDTPQEIIPDIPTIKRPSDQSSRPPKPRRGGIDTFMLVALAAIIIAIAVMVYGYVVEHGGNITLFNSNVESIGGESINSIEIEGAESITPDDLNFESESNISE